MKKIISLFTMMTFLLLLGIGFSGQSFAENLNDVIPDMNLRSAINEKLKVSDRTAPISKEQMESLTGKLSANGYSARNQEGKQISDLTGLQYAIHLDNIDIYYHHVSNIDPLKDLTNLKELSLAANKINNLDALKNLTNLERLTVRINDIEEISPVNSLTNLKYLNVEDNKIKTMGDLSALKKLEWLVFSNNLLEGVPDLSALENLQYLYVNNNGLNNLDKLGSLPKLRTLSIANDNKRDNQNTFTDLSFVNKYPALTGLYLSKNQVADLSTIKDHTGLDGRSSISALDQIVTIESNEEIVDNPLRKKDGTIIPIRETDNLKNTEDSKIRILGFNDLEKAADYEAEFNGYPIVGKIIIQAKPKVTVKFETNGGSPIPDLIQDKGTLLELPNNLTRSGYGFGGWFTDKALKNVFDKGKVVNENLVLYAKWTKTPVNSEEITVKRIEGKDRFETAIEVSKAMFTKADRVIIARNDQYPDSLSATVLAKGMKAPILLTRTNELDPRVKAEIQRLGAKEIIIVGGTEAISENTEKTLNIFDKEIERIAGKNRYETSAAMAKRVVELFGKKGKAVVASGENFPDALAISPLAAKEGIPILLTRKTTIDKSVTDKITELEIKEIIIVGGEEAIAKSIENSLPKVSKRVFGSNRYETAISIAKEYFENSTHAFLASGEKFADALVIGPLAAVENAPVLLTSSTIARESVKNYILDSKIEKLTVVGGKARIPEKIVTDLIAPSK